MKSWKTLRKQWLDYPKIKKEYDKLEVRYALIDKAIEERIKRKMIK